MNNDIKMLVSPYFPKGWVAMEDRSGISVFDSNTGNVIRLPKIEFPLGHPLPLEFVTKDDGKSIVADLIMKWRPMGTEGA